MNSIIVLSRANCVRANANINELKYAQSTSIPNRMARYEIVMRTKKVGEAGYTRVR